MVSTLNRLLLFLWGVAAARCLVRRKSKSKPSASSLKSPASRHGPRRRVLNTGIRPTEPPVVSLGSGVTLPGQQPNLTDSIRINRGFGVQCFVGGYVDGSLGTLAGARGPKQFDLGCIDYLNP